MKVRFIFPFLGENKVTVNEDLQIGFFHINEYWKSPSEFLSFYQKFNLMEEYFLSKGIKDLLNEQNAELLVPFIAFENYDKISPKSFPALCELIFNLFPFLIERISEYHHENKSSEGIIERGRRIICGIASDIHLPLIDLNDSHGEIFSHFDKLVQSKDFSRFQNALLYWRFSYEREDFIDSVLDLAISIESIFAVSDEQSLKIPIFVYHFLKNDRYSSLQTVYKLYQLRNTIIHGNELPVITSQQRFEMINVVAQILKKVISNEKLPKSKDLETDVYELYHQGL